MVYILHSFNPPSTNSHLLFSEVCPLCFGKSLKLTKGKKNKKLFCQMAVNDFWHLEKHEEWITLRSSGLRQSAQRNAAFGNIIRNTWVWQPRTHEACFCLLRPRQLCGNNSPSYPFFMARLLRLRPHQMCLRNIYSWQIHIWRFCQIFKYISGLSLGLVTSVPCGLLTTL